jgi:hypothetical protein
VSALVPSFRETIVLPRSGKEIRERLAAVTSNTVIQEPGDQPWFTGWVLEDRMRLALRANRPGPYAPVAQGKLEETSGGCILFMRFSLLPNMEWMLRFWYAVLLVGGLSFTYVTRQPMAAIAGLMIAVFIYLVVRSNFYLHLKPLRDAIRRAIA